MIGAALRATWAAIPATAARPASRSSGSSTRRSAVSGRATRAAAGGRTASRVTAFGGVGLSRTPGCGARTGRSTAGATVGRVERATTGRDTADRAPGCGLSSSCTREAGALPDRTPADDVGRVGAGPRSGAGDRVTAARVARGAAAGSTAAAIASGTVTFTAPAGTALGRGSTAGGTGTATCTCTGSGAGTGAGSGADGRAGSSPAGST